MNIPEVDAKLNFRVVLTDLALMHLLHAAFEAFVVPHSTSAKGRPESAYVETFGLLWGHKRFLRAPAGGRVRLVTVESAAPDTSTKRTRESFEPDSRALELKLDLNTSLWPERDLVGNYHSHPYGSPTKGDNPWATPKRRHLPSREDQSWARNNLDEWREVGLECSLIVTINDMKRARQPGPNAKLSPAVEVFNLSNYRVWIAAFRVVGSSPLEESEVPEQNTGESLSNSGVQLILPRMTMHTPFGRHDGEKHRVGHRGANEG